MYEPMYMCVLALWNDHYNFLYRYQLLKELGRGGFCVAYLAHRAEAPDENFCLKVEGIDSEKTAFRQLHMEVKIFQMMRYEEGFPFARNFCQQGSYSFMEMELLGPDIEQLFKANDHKFSMKCMCLMASQMITRLESLHQHNFIHRDVKPENFLIGRKEKATTIYLCDMGFCHQYRDPVTKIHHPNPPYKTGFTGTPRYSKQLN